MKKNTVKKINFSSGLASKTLVIIGIIGLILVIAVYVAITVAVSRQQVDQEEEVLQGPPQPVYEATVGPVRFIVQEARDLGSVLPSLQSYNPNLTTTERFIRVTIGAQNKGKTNLPLYSWDVGNITDSEGRNFVSINDRAFGFVPQPDTCGALLKPEFSPVPCVKLYEVSRASTDMKVTVRYLDQNNRRQEQTLDLIVN